MSPTPFNVPLNAKVVANHGTTSVFALRDGRLAFVDHATKRVFFDGSRDVGSGTYGSGHNAAWADARLTAVAALGGSASFSMTKALKPRQSSSPFSEPEQPAADLPDEPFARMLPFIPKEFLDWAGSYEVGDPLPPMMPGYGGETLCNKSINDVSYSQDGISVERLVDAGLGALGLPEVNPELAFVPEPETKGLPGFEQKGILGREIRDMVRNIADSILSARGLWKDELNKIRCGSGPNANRFTDIFGTGCDVPGSGVAGNVVGAVRGAVDLPGPVDEIFGRAEGAREKLADAADGPDVPGSRPSLGERLRATTSRMRGGYTPVYVADTPGDLDPAAGMSSVMGSRRSERTGFWGLRTLVSRNKIRERLRKRQDEYSKMRADYQRFVNSDEHKRWAADFELRTGRAPHFGERVDQYARHLGWNGSFKDDKGNPMTDNAGRPVGSFMGGADTAVVDGVTRPDLTHFEAMIDEIMMQTAYEFDTERMKRKNREKAEEAVGEYMLATLHAMMNAGGPKKLPDGTDNPEHKERFAEVVPTFMRIKHPLDGSNNRPELKNAYVIASVNSFFGDDPETAFPGLPRLNRNQVNGGGSVPLWMAASNLSSAPPVYAQISLDPWFFSKKESQAGRLAGIQETHLGMVPEREAFIAHTADHELNHIDDFMKRLGDKLGYTAIPQEAQVPTSEYGEAAWRKRLSEQRFNIYSGWQNQIDLVRDLQYMVVVAGYDANGQPVKELVPVSYFGRQVEELMMFLDPRNNRTDYERKRALWNFYMRNVRFNENVASEFARFLAAESPIAGVRITKADQQRILAKIIEDLEIRGFGEETGIPRLEFWGDMLDTPVGRWNPVSRQFEYPRDPISGELNVSPMNLMRPPSGNRAAFGQARLDNSVSNALHGFVGGTYAGESDFEFAAELRTHLNRQGALAEIREFLADSERNKQGLDESGFMTLVAKYVGTDEVHRLYGEKPPLRNAPTPSPSSAPPRRGGGSIGSTPRGIGAGGAAGRVRGSGTRPTVPMTPRADAPDSPTPPPASPGLRGTATRPTVPMAPRADAPADAPGDAPDVPPSSTGRVRGSGTRPTVPMAPRDATPGDAPESEAPSRVRGTGVRRPTRPTTDDDLVEPTVRTETDADRVSPERRRADADRERRVREVMGDDDGDLAEPTAKPETATRDDVEQYDDRRLIPEREEADRRAEEASRGMAKNRAAEATPSDRVERAVEDEKNNMVSSGRIRGRSDPMAMLKDPGDRARRARKLDEQVAARRKALDNASAATDPKERRGQQIVAAALEAELMYGVGEMDYGANERRQADLSILADLNGTPLYQDDEGIFKLESSVPEWQRTEGPESIDDSPESVASRTALAKEIFGEDQASEFLGTRSSETDGPIAGSQAARSRYKLQAGEPAPRTWSEERVNAEVRVMEAETSHDDALRKARATGSDPDRGGDGDPAAWADYRAAYDELNDADVERSRLSRESDEPEDRAPQSEAPTQAATADPSSEGANAERGAPRDQVRMVNKTTGETIYVDPSDARVMDEVTAEGFTRSNPKPSRKPTATRPDDPSNPPNTAAGNLMLMDTKKSDLAQAIIYDPKNGDLRVTYKDGRVVTFKNVWYERARKAGEDDRPDDLIEALEREQFQQISRPIGRLGDDGQGSGRQTGPRKRNRGGGRFHRMVNDSGDEILISVDDGDGYYDARRDGYRDRGMVGSADAGMLGRLSRRDQEIIRRESNRFNEEWRRQDRPGIGAEAGMASGDRSRTVGRVTRGTLRDRALAKLLDKILKRTGADEETKEKVKIGLGLATAFSAGGPAGAATYVAVEAARRGGRDLAEFTIDELLKRGKIDAEQARRAMAAVDRIAPDGLPDGARRQLGRAFSEAADLFNERINTPENRRRLAEMGEGIVDSARGRAREVGRRIGRPRGDVAEAGMGLPQGEVPNEKLPARNNWFTSNKIKKGGALKAQEILNFDRLRRKNRDEQASVLGVTREIIDKMHEPDASIEPFDADRLVVSALGANPMEIFGDAWLMADKTPERRKLQNIGKLDDRDNRILEIRANGGKVQDIADELKISKQRASFLLDRALRRNERDLDSQAEAGMAGARREGGSTYGRLVRKHADVVSTKRDEIDEARRSLANAARGARHRRGQTPAEKNAIYEERAAIYWAMNKLFSGNFRLDRENAGVRDVRIRVRNSPSHVTANRNGGLRIEIPMELTSPDGKVLYGHATNFVNVNSHGDIEIEHADIVVYDKYRGMGLASEFNARNENIYKAIGARSITLKGTSSSLPDSDNPEMPDMVFQTGATHWARNGFTWQDEKSKQNFIGVIDRALRDRPEIFSTEERQRIGSLYRKGGDGKFETRATAKDLVNFESADRLFAEDGAVVHYRRDLVPPGRRDKPGLGPEAGMAEAGRAMSRADAVNAEMERRNGPALKRDTDADAKTVMAMPPPFSARDSQTLTQVTADSDALTASIAQQRKALVEKYAPGRHGEPVESYADELMDNMGVARESGWSWPGGTPMTFSEQLDQAMDYFLRTAEQDGKEDQIPDPNDSFEDRELNHMKGAAKLAALELAQTEEGRREVREAMAQGFLDVLAGAEPALEKDPSLRRATTIRMHINDKSDWRKFAGYAQTELGRDGKVKLVVTLNPTILAFDSSLFFGSDEGPLSKGQGLSEVIRFAGADDYHFGLGVHEYAHLEHYKTWYSSLGLQVGRDAPPLSEQLDGRLDKSLMGTEIARRHNFPQDATWDDVRETFAKTNPLRDPANLETHASVIEATPEEWVDVQESQKTHDISWVHLAPPLDHSMNEIVERLYRLNQVRDQRRKEGGGFTGESMRERLMETMGTAGSTRKNVSADNFSRMVDALQTYDDTAANPFAGTFPENLTEDQKRSIIARNKMPEKVGSFFLALDDNSDETKFLGPEDVRKIVTEVLEGQTPEEFLATHKRIMDQVLGYDSKFASTLGVPTDDVMRVLGRSSKYGQTNIFEAVAEARVLTLYAERFREALSVKQLQQVEEMMEMLERIIPDGSVDVAVRNLTPEAKEHFARLERMLGKVPALKLDWDSVRQ